MTRRLLTPIALAAAAMGVWTLTTRLSSWVDGLSSAVALVARSWTFVERPASGGIDFVEIIECMGGCGPYANDGLLLVIVALFCAGTPLAVSAFAVLQLQRRGRVACGASLGQIGFIVQVAAILVSLPAFAAISVALTDFASAVFSGALLIGVIAVSNVVLGLPAIFAWRRLVAGAIREHRPQLQLTPRA